jgi:hypothetical protein
MPKMITTKSLSDDRAKFLNSLDFLKENSIAAVNTQWTQNGETFCELYSRKTRKRIRIKTHLLFERQDFINNPNDYLKNKDYVQKIMEK